MVNSPMAPLAGLTVAVHADGVAAAYAGRLLGSLGARVLLLEPPNGSALRREPPWLDPSEKVSAVFAWLAAGAESLVCNLETEAGRDVAYQALQDADVLIDDAPLEQRKGMGIDAASMAQRFPQLVHVSILPFGAEGPKADWKAADINLQHASGEGNLLPNGLSIEMFPDRPPVKIHGHFAELQGGIAAALGALSALLAQPQTGGQFVDVSSQDAALAVGAFAVQRYGDGALEHRRERSFRYGGVLPCADGFVELLTLEQRQWRALVKLLGSPDWANDPALDDSLERSRRGPEINAHIRDWASSRAVADIVARGQALGVPIAPYNTPADVLEDPHVRERGLFAPVDIDGVGTVDMLVAPFQFGAGPLALRGGPPGLNQSDASER